MQNFLSFFKSIKSEFEENHKVADFIFTIIILFVSLTSFFHVMEYWTLTNKAPFYVITAIATELFILGSMLAIRYTSVAWIPFIFGIFVQGIGNVFYSYINIQVDSVYFLAFQELFKPMFEIAYGDELELANYKRVLAYSNGLFYLSPIVFLWAKLSLKSQTKKLNLKALNDLPIEKSGGDTPPEPDDLGDIKPLKSKEQEEPLPEEVSPSTQPSQQIEVKEVQVETNEIVEEVLKEEEQTIKEVEQVVEKEAEEVIKEEEQAIKEEEEQEEKTQNTPTKRVFSFNPATPPLIEKKKLEQKPDKDDGIQIWTNILHEVARDNDYEQDNEKVLKVREVKRPVGNVKITDKFTIAGLKPENK